MKIERCPDYCPFLEKDAVQCHLFDTHLVLDVFILKCPECMDADLRKTQYQKKIKDFNQRQYLWDKALKRTPSKLWQKVKTNVTDFKERKEIKDFISAISKDFPILLDKKTSKLLLNLYLVLDSSEKALMKDILSNPKMAESFLSKIKQLGARGDLLKQVRREMDDMHIKQQKEKKLPLPYLEQELSR